jgi:L-glyceraldehyde 3-phosphate reductase
MPYDASPSRYDAMPYRRSGTSGLRLGAISLGLWHNFGGVDGFETARAILRRAFDLGVIHVDLANNYGPPPGSAEETLGRVLRLDLAPYRDELVISTKAGYRMWPGPYGDFGSRKYLVSSLDQSLRRMGLDRVDIFYHHRPDPDTPLEESMAALDFAVRSGRALYAGISNYPAELAERAASILRGLGTPCVIHQPRYNLFDRAPERGLLDTLAKNGIGCIAFSPLGQGLLTARYLGGVVPEGSRASKAHGALRPESLTLAKLAAVERLAAIARERGQSLAQMSLAWVLRHPGMTSVLVGASSPAQVEDNVGALKNLSFSADELARIDEAVQESA